MNWLKLQFATDATCTKNALGAAVVNGTAQGQLQTSIDTSIMSGGISILFAMLGLTDLTGTNQAMMSIGTLNGTPAMGMGYNGTSDVDWYVFAVPLGGNGSMQVTVQSAGFSLLRPSTAAMSQGYGLGGADGPAAATDGTTASFTATGLLPGQLIFLAVAGLDATAFGTGKYALTLNFGNNPTPTPPLPRTMLSCGSRYCWMRPNRTWNNSVRAARSSA